MLGDFSRLIFSLFFLLYGCGSDDSWKENLNGTGGNIDPDAISSCSNAEFGDWQESDYYLPYPVGHGYIIGLNACSDSYHAPGQPDQFAIDFNMPIGERIIASRAGTVVFVEESGFDGGFPNNLVVLRHQDGTHAMYMHLTNGGAAVSVGSRVPRGGLIGYSGNTGLAGYPHLHFVVVGSNYSYPYNSIPVNFRNTSPNERSLQSGNRYEALPD